MLASTGTFDAVYAPSNEVIVKLSGGIHDSSSEIIHSLPIQSLSSHLLIRNEQKTGPAQSAVESTQSQQHRQQQQQRSKKSYFSLDNFATNPDELDNGLMNDYATDYYVESQSPQMYRNKVHASNEQRWMKSSKDLSQNRDAGNSARGSATSLLF